MKTNLGILKLTSAVLLAFAFSLSASANTKSYPGDQVYQFKFRMKGDLYEYSQKSSSYEEAFERAAKACYQHFKGGRHINEDQGLDIIDVCANPRST